MHDKLVEGSLSLLHCNSLSKFLDYPCTDNIVACIPCSSRSTCTLLVLGIHQETWTCLNLEIHSLNKFKAWCLHLPWVFFFYNNQMVCSQWNFWSPIRARFVNPVSLTCPLACSHFNLQFAFVTLKLYRKLNTITTRITCIATLFVSAADDRQRPVFSNTLQCAPTWDCYGNGWASSSVLQRTWC